MKRSFILITLCLQAILFSCEKHEVKVTTQIEIINVEPSATSLFVKGEIIVLSDADHEEYGFCYDLQPNPTVDDGKLMFRSAKLGVYTGVIEGLTLGKIYYIRAYCKEGNDFLYGRSINVTTRLNLPTITTTVVSNINSTTVSSGGNVTSDGGTTITERGVCYSTTPNPNVSHSMVISAGTTGSFVSIISGLTANQLYFFRAYATNSVGTAYGNEVNNSGLEIGNPYQGGRIAYINPSSSLNALHGIIAAPSDQSAGIQWYNGIHVTTSATSKDIGSGNDNTIAIVNIQGEGSYAAKLCYDLDLNGYSDWYLPSKDELNQLYINSAVIGGFKSENYWSSSESDRWHGWIQDFIIGATNTPNDKIHYFNVRAVRSF